MAKETLKGRFCEVEQAYLYTHIVPPAHRARWFRVAKQIKPKPQNYGEGFTPPHTLPRNPPPRQETTRQDKCLLVCPNTIQKGTSNTKGFSRPFRPDQTREVPFNVPKHNPKRHSKHKVVLITTSIFEDKTQEQKRRPGAVFQSPVAPIF